jgi:ATP synthase A1 C subunit
MMATGEYDYLNARVRGMSRHFIPTETLQEIVNANDAEVVVDVLMDSSYASAISEARTTHSGITAVEVALRTDLYETLRKVREIAPESPRRLISIQLNRWDVDNVVALVHGVVAGVPADEITEGLIPAGEYRPVQLNELAGETDVRSLMDALTTWGYEFAPALRRALLDQGEDIDANVAEADLFTAYVVWAFDQLDPKDANHQVLYRLLQLQIDLKNVVSVLKRVQYKSLGVDAPELHLLPGGSFSTHQLRELDGMSTVPDALGFLETTKFAPGIERGVLSFGGTDRVSGIERFLEAVVIGHGIGLFRDDPLSAAVPLGFIWRKVNEYDNLRMILRGKHYSVPPNRIREALVLV